MRRLVTLVVLLAPSLCLAQQPKYELTAMLGSRWGGNILVNDQAFQHQTFDLDIDDQVAFGLRFGIALKDNLQLELLVSHQDTAFQDDNGLFGEDPGWILPPGPSDYLDVGVTYYHGGLLWQWVRGMYRWYVVGSAGVTRIDMNLPLGADTRLSASVGGGLKMDLTDRLGLRFATRYYWTDTDSGTKRVQYLEHQDCTVPCTYTYSYDDALQQIELSVGLILKF